jgi:hypothetical protein
VKKQTAHWNRRRIASSKGWSDLSKQLARGIRRMRGFKKWTDLQQFHEVVKNLNYPRIHRCLQENNYTIPFGLKIKLHGTNACIRIEHDGKVVAQKRSSDIVAPADNAGFRAWVEDNEAYFARLANSTCSTYVFGEWCGPGIQSDVACSMTRQKFFYVFAIEYFNDEEFISRIYNPSYIEKALEFGGMPDGLIVLPWQDHIKINFLEKAQTDIALLKLNKLVEAIGECDPFIEKTFEIQGAGEGVVAYPLLGENEGSYLKGEEYFGWFGFKAKSEAHRVNKTKKAATFDPEKYASTQLFADAYCSEQRFLQGFTEAVQGRKDMRLTPDFIRWVVQDIWKESKTEREASPDLDWKTCCKAISSRAVMWYKSKVQELEHVV